MKRNARPRFPASLAGPATPKFRGLPLLRDRARELSLCVYCPKLCRSACPVSNAEPREALTPWGKMSSMFFVAEEHVESSPSFTSLAWACTGCEGCKNSCNHRNPVAETLTDARANIFALGKAPPEAVRTARAFGARKAEIARRVAQAKARHGLPDGAEIGIIAGCTYIRRVPDVADAVIRSAVALTDPANGGASHSTHATLVTSCCGGSLAMAGDREGQREELRALAHETRTMRLLVVGDPGCAYAIKKDAAALGIIITPKIVTLVELAAMHVDRLARIPGEIPVFHDPCHLGRGLGLVSEPRSILTRLFGAPPHEMPKNRENTSCSGGGGLLPLTMPDVSRAIAKERAEGAGGHTLVTACAQSLRSFRNAGNKAEDLATLIARGLDAGDASRANGMRTSHGPNDTAKA